MIENENEKNTRICRARVVRLLWLGSLLLLSSIENRGIAQVAASQRPAGADPTVGSTTGQSPVKGTPSIRESGQELSEQSIWQALIDIITGEGGGGTGGKGGPPCEGTRWVLQAPLGGGHHLKPERVQWTRLPGAESYAITLSDLKGDAIWRTMVQADSASAQFVLESPFPEDVWGKLIRGQVYRLRLEARSPDGSYLTALELQLWAVSEESMTAWEKQVDIATALLCRDRHLGGLECADFQAITRAALAMADNKKLYTGALGYVAERKPQRRTWRNARRQLSLPPALRKDFTSAESYTAIVLARGQSSTCVETTEH